MEKELELMNFFNENLPLLDTYDYMASVLVTCPNLIHTISDYNEIFETENIEYYCPSLKQSLSEEELIKLVPQFHGWIAGDDPATRNVLEAGKKGNLRVLIKWGVGTDNIDIEACKDLEIKFSNTPNMFGNEVADVAIGYMINLTRQLHTIHAKHSTNEWYKPLGTSVQEKNALVIGFGDIGQHLVKRLLAFDMNVYTVDPSYHNTDKCISSNDGMINIENKVGTIRLTQLETAVPLADFIFITCALNKATHHLINRELLLKTKPGVRIINVSRGAIVKTDDIIPFLADKHISGYATDVFEEEPLPEGSYLRMFDQCMFGSHNGSNTIEAVHKTNKVAIDLMINFLFYNEDEDYE